MFQINYIRIFNSILITVKPFKSSIRAKVYNYLMPFKFFNAKLVKYVEICVLLLIFLVKENYIPFFRLEYSLISLCLSLST